MRPSPRAQALAFALALPLALMVPALAHAQFGAYVGASAGEASLDLDLSDVEDAGFRIEDEDFAFKVFVGLTLPGPFAIEAGYRDLGSVSGNVGPVAATAETQALDAAALAKLALGPVKFFVKYGIVAWDAEVSTEGAGPLPDLEVSDDGTDPYWGVGLQVDLGRFGVRGEYERFEIEAVDDLTMLSVGVTVKF